MAVVAIVIQTGMCLRELKVTFRVDADARAVAFLMMACI